MGKPQSMTRKHNHDYDASITKRITICDDGSEAPWSDLNHDLLYLVMMQLGVVDFIAFSGVCKSWRSFALSKRNNFMASRPPMSIWISIDDNEKDYYCYLQDFERRRFRTILPHSAGRRCVGLTCGYLILFGRETPDFWLVNPITRHELHFPDVPFYVFDASTKLSAIIVFSPSISGWVFVVLRKFMDKIWFSIAGKGEWSHVSSTYPIVDLHAFKGKIYTINTRCRPFGVRHLCELRLNPEPKLTLLETNNHLKIMRCFEFLSSGENLYVMQLVSHSHKVHEIDFGEMNWVTQENTRDGYTFFLSDLSHGAAIKLESLVDADKFGKDRFFYANMWYFPHECLNVHLLHE